MKNMHPYFEAVKNILDGIPVLHLDRLREQYNRDHISTTPQGLNPTAIIFTFAANAENRVLMGESVEASYGGFKNLDPHDFRKRVRGPLEYVVEHGL